ncbi:MAG: hypothetical protein ACXWTY_06110 [Methylobacter sp.]
MLTAYFLHDHISLKFLVEIAIISCTVGVLSNTKNLEFPVLVLLALFGTINLVIYLLFEEKLESLEHHRNC